ncbi:ABC transporter permease [Hypericibacter adhaerens]|uniref:ABC transporter permease n=1 Tax=Hypericibacter adhaerens TaxID=2602016 RepID=A0A5J6MSM1_9PROT|nr:SMP-30/gluconolactonase/LRE family protein [Hypericibacter adhaerens]QEX20364.1 ABC transporter permease [Hypericibacter adhaerens]
MALAGTDALMRWRYRLLPDHLLGEILAKRWIDNLIPFAFLLITIGIFGSVIPDFYSIGYLSDATRQLGEFLLIVIGLLIVMLGGGIDLSVGSTFALANLVALIAMNILGWPVWAAFLAVVAVNGLVGLMNGVLVGYLRLRAFLTTLVTLIMIRAVVDMLLLKFSVQIAGAYVESDLWFYLGDGTALGVPFSFIVAIVIAVIAHIFLSRSRLGWHVSAIGGSRRSAYNIGIPVRRTVCMTYVLSAALAGVAGFLFAARLGGAGADTGVGLDIQALTAAVLGGNSLGGGRGSVVKGILGSIIVLLVSNGLVRLGFQSGATSMVLGLILLMAVSIDVRWLKNRHKVLSKLYVSPTYFRLPTRPSTLPDSGSPYALNDKLRQVEVIGLGQIEGPEDVILDRDDNLYCGSRHGDIVKFHGPDHKRAEIFAHIGGHPLGMAFDREGHLQVCVGGMGLYAVSPKGEVRKMTDETNRSPRSIIDDARVRFADDLDIAPDGRIFFSEASIRYESQDWAVDGVECRPNGRVICHDPRTGTTRTVLRNIRLANGICMASDGQSLLLNETWACRVLRYWFDGPKAGRTEIVLDGLPGYPDNVNRASDGNYWLAIVGMRTPILDLALRKPGFRRRMARRIPMDEWLYPNINTGCIVKFNEKGEVLDALWDLGGQNHPMITSMREHRGHLYIGGIYNNRIGKYRIPGADPTWTAQDHYWGSAR